MSLRSKASPGSVQGRARGGPVRLNGAYVAPRPPIAPKIDWKAEWCPTCEVERGELCINMGTRTGIRDKGKPMTNPHPSRKRLAIRTRNRRIERGEEQVVTEETRGRTRKMLEPREGQSVGECRVCHLTLPLVGSLDDTTAVKEAVLARHTPEGYRYRQSAAAVDVECIGSGLGPVSQ